MTLSQDLRLRIVDLVGTGVSRRQAARQFKVGVSSAIRFVKQAEELGHVAPKKARKRKSRLDRFRADILGWIADQPGLTPTRSPIKKRHTPVNKNVAMFAQRAHAGANVRIG